MLTVFSDAHRLHHGTELKDGVLKPSFEQPSRADTVRDRVRQVGLGDIIVPRTFDRACYVNAHSERYVSFLETAWAQWTAIGRSHDALPLVWPVRDLANQQVPDFIDGKLGFFAMDAGSPITRTTWDAVKTSADIALTNVAPGHGLDLPLVDLVEAQIRVVTEVSRASEGSITVAPPQVAMARACSMSTSSE